MEPMVKLDAHDWNTALRTAFRGELLPSRRRYLADCTEGLAAGPVLMVGEAGVGKSYLLEHLIRQDERSWVQVDLSPSVSARGLLGSLAQRLGGEAGRSTGRDLAALLEMEGLEGRRWGLALDEFHCATNEALEEVRVLANRLGQADGFDAIVAAGQTAILQRLRTRGLSGLRARLGLVAPVPPISADEVAGLFETPLEVGEERARRWHREGGGNPGRILQIEARSRLARARILDAAHAYRAPATTEVAGLERAEEPEAASEAISSALIPSAPPLQLDDETIEVGWHDNDLTVESEAYEPLDSEPAHGLEPAEQADEPVVVAQPVQVTGPAVLEDHYAALQAWNEWSQNQQLASGTSSAAGVTSQAAGEVAEVQEEGWSRVRAEGQHMPASPHSHLYTRASGQREGDH